MAHRDIVLIGGSAGGIPALIELFARLGPEWPFAFFVVVHTSPSSPGMLPSLLSQAGPMRASFAREGEEPEHGRIYVAPADYHLLFREQKMRVAHGPKENGFR